VLDEVELLVGGSDHEVLALDLAVLADLAAVGPDHGEARFTSERWV
jgi:hypothetical protein